MTKSAALEILPENNEDVAISQEFSAKVDRSVLIKALGHVQSVVERRNTMQILANVKIVAEGGFLRLTATDTDIEITESIPADISEEGAITVPAQTFYEIVRKLPDGSNIELIGKDSGGGNLKINAGSCSFSLASLPVNDFPAMENENVTHSFKLMPLELIALIDKTRFAVSAEETRYYLNGIFLHTHKKDDGEVKLCAVATDGHRLAKVEIDAPDGLGDMKGVIIPRKTIAEIRKLLEDIIGEVEILLSDTKISFIFNNAVLISKLIDGTFPDYDRVIPTGNDKDAEVDSVALARAVDRVSTISTEKTRAIRFALENGKLIISAISEGNGAAREELEIKYSESDIETGFNSRYLLEMMAVIKGAKVQFRMRDGNAPALVTDCDDPTAVFVIMPMRI